MQIKNSFDRETVIKILKGAVYAIVPAAMLALVEYIGTIKVSDPMLAAFIVWATPFAVNAIKEWRKEN
jgi:hypothetical protein